MKGWQQDKRWSDRYMPYVKAVLGEHLIAEAPEEVDQNEATDLRVVTLRPFTVAVRIRSHQEFDKRGYRDEFTIRCSRPSGASTEFEKIVRGWADYMFYGFAGAGNHVRAYNIIDLRAFRYYVTCCYARKRDPWRFKKQNTDGSSDFFVFGVADLPESAIVAREGFQSEAAA